MGFAPLNASSALIAAARRLDNLIHRRRTVLNSSYEMVK